MEKRMKSCEQTSASRSQQGANKCKRKTSTIEIYQEQANFNRSQDVINIQQNVTRFDTQNSNEKKKCSNE